MRPGWLAAFVLFCGTLAFAISLVGAFLSGLATQQINRLIWAPEMVGCVLFLVSGHIGIIEVCHGRLRWLPSSLGWWIVIVNQIGSWLFFASGLAAFVRPATGEVINVSMVNWGTALGAACFSAAGMAQLFERPAQSVGAAVTRHALLCHDGEMTDRLSATDASFLYAEDAGTPMHVGGVVILKPDADGPEFQYSEIVDLIESRLDLVPRYRQKVRFVPGRLARPVWVDDEDFDLTYHVRRSAIPKPGTDVELDELVGRLISRPLDRTRPLWEVYVIEGLDRRPDRAGQQDPPGDGRSDRGGGRCGCHPGYQPAVSGSAGPTVDPEPVAQ